MKNLISHLTLAILITLSGCKGSAFTKNQNSNNTDNSTSTSSTEETTIINAGASTGGSSCADILPSDGPGGFLWRPISVSTGNDNALTALPSTIDRETIQKVCIRFEADPSIEDCGEFDPEATINNDNRPIYRFSMPGSFYVSPLKIYETNGVVCEVTIDDTSVEQN